MIRFKAVAIASVMLLVLVAGCNNEDQANENIASTPVAVKKKPKPKAAAPAASPGAEGSPGAKATSAAKASPAAKTAAAPAGTAKGKAAATAKTTDIKPTLTKLKGYLPAAVKALQANDTGTAKQYAQDFNANWNQKIIQSNVKSSSQDAHKKISAAVAQVNNSLIKPATPDNTKAIAALQSLSKAVDEYTQSQ
jgi:hypothetical protein